MKGGWILADPASSCLWQFKPEMPELYRIAFVFLTSLLISCTSSPREVLDVTVSVTNPKFGDSNRHDWSGKKPWNYPVHGIDVAKYQGQINWAKAKAAGIGFAFIKATEGGDRVDERFHENWAATKRIGLPRGAYHFFYFCRPAIEQAAWFIKHVPNEPGTLPPVLDMEWNHKSPSCKTRPDAQTVRSEMTIFLNKLTRHYKKRPIVYTSVDFYRTNQINRIKGYEFWLRSVADHPASIYPGQRWTFWQYTGTGTVPGIDGNTDINVFSGSTGSWRKWIENRAK